jgi:hypothetical protein
MLHCPEHEPLCAWAVANTVLGCCEGQHLPAALWQRLLPAPLWPPVGHLQTLAAAAAAAAAAAVELLLLSVHAPLTGTSPSL